MDSILDVVKALQVISATSHSNNLNRTLMQTFMFTSPFVNYNRKSLVSVHINYMQLCWSNQRMEISNSCTPMKSLSLYIDFQLIQSLLQL